MKLALVYDKTDYKLLPASYSQNYRNMMLALIERFEDVQHVNESCHANDVEADVIVYFDPHSTHEIEIEDHHDAVKYEYCNDPHQWDMVVQYPGGKKVHKLGAAERCHRIHERGVSYVICPSRWGYERYLAPHLEHDMLLWWPVAPSIPDIEIRPLSARWKEIAANGHCWKGQDGFVPYAFRGWAYGQPGVTYVPHAGDNPKIPTGNGYMQLMARFVGGLALCNYYVVAKYLEIPLAGCVCLAQKLPEYQEMGFEDEKNCLFVDMGNFHDRVRAVKEHPEQYQALVDTGRKQALQWTADKFATFIYGHAHAVCADRCSRVHCAETL